MNNRSRSLPPARIAVYALLAAAAATSLAFILAFDHEATKIEGLLSVFFIELALSLIPALPVLLVLLLCRVLITRLAPGLASSPLGMTLLLALIGLGGMLGAGAIFIGMVIERFNSPPAILSPWLLSCAIGGIVEGVIVARDGRTRTSTS